MKKFLLAILVILGVGAVAAFVFQKPLMRMAADAATRDMFIAADTDAFDPGLAVGEPFPPLVTLSGGTKVTDLMQFSGANGLVLLTNRSVDW